NDTKRTIPVARSAPERTPRPPEPETSRLLEAVRAIDPGFCKLSDPALAPDGHARSVRFSLRLLQHCRHVGPGFGERRCRIGRASADAAGNSTSATGLG